MSSKNKRDYNKAKCLVKQPCYRSQVVGDKTKYKRKSKHRGNER